MKFGTLDFEPAASRNELVSAAVRDVATRNPAILVAPIDPALSDTAAFCEHYGIGMGQSANCVIVEAKRAERVWYAAVVVLATTRADLNGIVRKKLEARKVSFAARDDAIKMTGMEFGGITPIGLPGELSLLIDAHVTQQEYVVIGSGVRQSKLLVKPAVLTQLPNAEVLDLAQ